MLGCGQARCNWRLVEVGIAVVVDAVCNILDGPVESVHQMVPRVCAARLDPPAVRRDIVELEMLLDLFGRKGTWDVLFVGKDQDSCAVQSLLLEQVVELELAVGEAGGVGGIDDPDDGIRLFKVVLPVRPQALLAANIPHVEVVVTVLEGLDREAECGRDGLNLVLRLVLKLFEDGRLACVVEAEKEEAELVRAQLRLADDGEQTHRGSQREDTQSASGAAAECAGRAWRGDAGTDLGMLHLTGKRPTPGRDAAGRIERNGFVSWTEASQA
ncbi:hypothetical protein L1887_56653 [Cichorium endivia]|nr:hypothetical protein L1887_56653 [Cichorium endivia]